MRGEQLTASAIVRFAAELEADMAAFYDELARHLPQHEAALTDFAERCRKTATQVQRTYQETVTDALETGFAFEGLALQAYEADLKIDLEADPAPAEAQALDRALALEKTAAAFYQDVADRSGALLATIPRAFKRAARTHRRRRDTLSDMT